MLESKFTFVYFADLVFIACSNNSFTLSMISALEYIQMKLSVFLSQQAQMNESLNLFFDVV